VRRRDFIGILASAAAAWPWSAGAERSPKMPRIGIIDDGPVWDAFRKALRDLGYAEGQTIAFEYRATDGKPDRLDQAATELAAVPVDLIATFGTPASKAAQRATATIPIVMVSIGDPIGSGLVANTARPGGNLTGNTILGAEMAAKRVQLLKELLPNAARVAFLRNPGNESHALILEELRTAAARAGVEVVAVDARTAQEFDPAFAGMMEHRPDALMATNDPLQQLNMEKIIPFLTSQRVPGFFQARENVLAGGLVSYGASLPELFRRAAGYAHRILTGTKPADLPVEQPMIFELVVNMKTAKAIGLAIPDAILLRADEIIE